MQVIVAVSGYKDSGKTALCRRLAAELVSLGVRAAYIKRTAEEGLLSVGGTDTASVREVRAPTMLWGKSGLVVEEQVEESAKPREIVSRYFPEAEIVILEGGKELELPKIWVRKKDEAVPDFPGIFMVYDRFNRGDGKKFFTEGDEAVIAKKLLRFIRGKSYRSATVFIGDRQLPMKDFVANFVRGGILGMLAALKGGDASGEVVKVYIDGDTEGKSDPLAD